MNDDEQFFKQFQESPPAAYVEALYQRIDKPMLTHRKPTALSRTALSFAGACALLVALLFAYPPSQAQALQWLRQIGVFTITTDLPLAGRPTASPPELLKKALQADSAAEASRLAGFGVLAPQTLPDGYTAHGAFSIDSSENGKTVTSAYANPAAGAFLLINQFQYLPGAAITDAVTGQETVEDVRVRGFAGVWISDRWMTSPLEGDTAGQNRLRPTNWLRWEENGVVYTLFSDGLDQEEMLSLANSLK